jgi:hypothetical protein
VDLRFLFRVANIDSRRKNPISPRYIHLVLHISPLSEHEATKDMFTFSANNGAVSDCAYCGADLAHLNTKLRERRPGGRSFQLTNDE